MGKQIRILHVLGSLNMGGAETMIMNIYRNIDRKKIQFDFVVHGNEIGTYEAEIKKMGGKIYRMPRYKVFNHFLYKKAWCSFFKDHKNYQIIHGHMRSTASIYLAIAKKYELVTICHSHSTSNGTGIGAIVKKVLQSRIKKCADYLFGCSFLANEWLYGKGINQQDNCYIIKNAIDSKKFCFNDDIRNSIRKSLNIENCFVIGQVGRFVSVKNHQFTIQLFKKYIETNPLAVLLLIGDGPLENTILNYIKEYNLEKKVLILKSRDDVNDLMQAMDLFIMPSIYEGLPLTLIEAQASSLPCIVSDTINSGFLIDSLINKVSLNSGIETWIKAIDDARVISRIDRTKEIVDSGFDITTSVKWLENFYFKINR